MLESLLFAKKKSTVGVVGDHLVFYEFESLALGSKNLVDSSVNKINLTPTGSAGGADFGVVNHPTIGKCFQFNGGAWFSSADPLNDFGMGSYDLEIGFLKPNYTAQALFVTGDWNGTIEDGKSLSIDSYDTMGQIFVMSAGNFTRQSLPGTHSQNFCELLVEKRNATTKITNKSAGVSVTHNNIYNPPDSYFNIGASKDGRSPFVGYLKYLRLRKVTEV